METYLLQRHIAWALLFFTVIADQGADRNGDVAQVEFGEVIDLVPHLGLFHGTSQTYVQEFAAELDSMPPEQRRVVLELVANLFDLFAFKDCAEFLQYGQGLAWIVGAHDVVARVPCERKCALYYRALPSRTSSLPFECVVYESVYFKEEIYMSREIGGNQCLIVTPLKEDESVDEESTRNMIDFLIQHGVHGILVHGSTGEGFLFDTDERKAFANVVVKHVNGRVPVGFCVESSSTAVSVELSKYAKKAGVDYLFTTAPYRHPHKGTGIFEHFKAINDATDLPIAIYDGGAGVELGLDLLEKISNELHHIKYCKIFLEKPEKIAQIADRCKGRIVPWAGHDRLTYLMLCYGAYGMTSAASCIIPRENSDMFDLVKAGNLEEGRRIYLSKVCPLNAMAFYSVLDFISAYKLALYWMRIITTPTVRKPLLQLDSVMQRELRGALKFIGKL